MTYTTKVLISLLNVFNLIHQNSYIALLQYLYLSLAWNNAAAEHQFHCECKTPISYLQCLLFPYKHICTYFHRYPKTFPRNETLKPAVVK